MISIKIRPDEICAIVFSNGNFGEAIFVRTNGNQLQGVLSLLVFLFQVFALPILTFWYLKRQSKKEEVPDVKFKQ